MEALLIGLGLGLAAGVSPGPLMVLVLQATLQRGFVAGARVAVAPLLTDLPILVLALGVADALPRGFLPWLSILGGLFVAYLGIDTWREVRAGVKLPDLSAGASEHPPSGGGDPSSDRDLWKGALVNIASPHPWLFWLAIGGPQVVALWRSDRPAAPVLAAAFLALFYVGLVGTKVVMAAMLARGRKLFVSDSRTYGRVLGASGIVLIALGLWLAASGALQVFDRADSPSPRLSVSSTAAEPEPGSDRRRSMNALSLAPAPEPNPETPISEFFLWT